MSRLEHEPAPVFRLHPIRVLLVSRDRRFLRMANVLLSRHGCEVASIERPSGLLDRVEHRPPNVVVLDGSESLATTARRVAALDALPAPVPSVIVYEGAEEDPLRHLRMLPKWGGFEEIVFEVERAYRGGWSGHGAAEDSLF